MPRTIAAFAGLLALYGTASLTPAHAAAEDAPKTEDEAKPAFTLEIRCDETELKEGDEIPIVFVIKNVGNSDLEYTDRNYDRSGRMEEFELSAVDEQGRTVTDPRAKPILRIGGGLAGEGRLTPDKSFTRTIALNRWALLTVPGEYRVTGTYHTNYRRQAIISPPIRLVVHPRSDDEMAAYVHKLSAELAETSDQRARAALVRKLMYTCDRRAIAALIEAMYISDAANFWAGEAFHCYLPRSQDVSNALLNAATTRGFARGMFWTLKELGFTREQIKPLIDVSLSEDHPDAWPTGALAAQQYTDDRFTPRLIAIATDPASEARAQAIYALANNRTDESVAALKELLREPDPPRPMGRTIRQWTEDAIRGAYTSHANTDGRRLRTDDFDTKYQRRSDAQ